MELPKDETSTPDSGGQLQDWLKLFEATTREELEEVATKSPELRKAAAILLELHGDAVKRKAGDEPAEQEI